MKKLLLLLVLSAPGHLYYIEPAGIDYFTTPTQNQCAPQFHTYVHFISGGMLCVEQTPEQIEEQLH